MEPGRFSSRPGQAGSRLKRGDFFHINAPSLLTGTMSIFYFNNNFNYMAQFSLFLLRSTALPYGTPVIRN